MEKTPYEQTPEYALGIDEVRRKELREIAKNAVFHGELISESIEYMKERVEDPVELLLCGTYFEKVFQEVKRFASQVTSADALADILGILGRIED